MWHKILRRTPGRFAREDDGAALAETIVVLPVMVIFLAGILEFGALLYTKLQVETGLREAARYMARCHATGTCSETTARNLAVYGNPQGTGSPRALGWSSSPSVVSISTLSPTPAAGGENFDVVEASTSFAYPGSPFMGLIGLVEIPITARHQDRIIGY